MHMYLVSTGLTSASEEIIHSNRLATDISRAPDTNRHIHIHIHMYVWRYIHIYIYIGDMPRTRIYNWNKGAALSWAALRTRELIKPKKQFTFPHARAPPSFNCGCNCNCNSILPGNKKMGGKPTQTPHSHIIVSTNIGTQSARSHHHRKLLHLALSCSTFYFFPPFYTYIDFCICGQVMIMQMRSETRNFPKAADSKRAAGSMKPSKVQTTVCTVGTRNGRKEMW